MKEINGELKSALVEGGGGGNKVEMRGRRRRRTGLARSLRAASASWAAGRSGHS